MMLNVPVCIHTLMLMSPVAYREVVECFSVYSYANVPSYPEVIECHSVSVNAHTVSVLYAGYPKVVYRHIST